jgi:hypothetical protein
MKYMLLMYWNQADVPQTPEEQQAIVPAWMALLQETKAEGVLVDNNGLAPSSNATSVRVREGKTLVTDGPFAETHEQLGGYFLLDLPNLDEALKWAAKIPAARYGTIEVRPLWNGQ